MTQAARRKLGQSGSGRAVFAEVSGQTRAPVAAPGEADRRKARARVWVARWLTALAVLAVAILLVSGAMRLSGIGLPLAGWDPMLDAIPPLSEQDWQSAMARHQPVSPEAATPPDGLAGSPVTPDSFKTRYWWGWGLGMLGLVTGLVWAVGLAVLALKRMVPKSYRRWVVLPGVLAGAQAASGWWMARGGWPESIALLGQSPYGLTLQLALSSLILGLLLWPAWKLQRSEMALLQARRRREGGIMAAAAVLLVLAGVQIVIGALAAGSDAGLRYTDWPLMDGHILPPESFDLTPGWRNVFENPALVEFNHRFIAYGLAIWATVFAVWARRPRLPGLARWSFYALLVVLAQAIWGVVTVLHGGPLIHTLVHKAGALVTLAVVLRARFEAAYPQDASIRGGA